jgi:hypothetical protein
MGNDEVAVSGGSKQLRKLDLADRTITVDLSRARVAGSDLEDRLPATALLTGGEQIALRARVGRSKAPQLPLRVVRITIKKKHPPAPTPPPVEQPPVEQPPVAPPPVEQPPVEQPPVEQPPAGNPSQQHRGVSTALIWGWVPEQESARDIREAAALGADTIRVTFTWDYLQPSGPGAIPEQQAALIDRLLAVARSEGLRVVAVPYGTPCWASTAPKTGGWCASAARIYPPTNPADYGAFVAQIDNRWGDYIAGYEVWNEPNHPGFWNGTPADYVALVRATDAAISASRHPQTRVVAGALSGSDTDYLQKLYNNDVDRWSDAISIHPYAIRWDQGMVDPLLERAGDIWSFASGVPAVHSLMTANGDSHSLWITEFGYATCSTGFFCVTATQQGDYLAAALRRAAEWPYVDTFLMYDLRDWTGPGADINQQFGLLNEDWSPKAGTATVKRALADLR